MSELRRDPVTGRHVIIAAARQKRPSDFRVEPAAVVGRERCPFCPGHEAMTPPEVWALRPDGSRPDTPGWEMRVVPNKFPAVQRDGAPVALDGMFERLSAIGAHEVIVETPDHDRVIAAMSDDEVERVLSTYRERIVHHAGDPRLRHVLVFKNHGDAAGATLVHPHSQLIALPVVPDFVREELDGVRRHREAGGRCIFCDIVEHERRDRARIVDENADVAALTPWAARFPFETWLVPVAHAARFEAAAPAVARSLARLLKTTLQRLDAALDRPAFNLIVHTAPLGADEGAYHWHVEVWPKLARAAGFEWGSGLYINPMAPERAAEVLRSMRV